MFNEAFMFFWLVSIVENLQPALVILGLVSVVPGAVITFDAERPKIGAPMMALSALIMFSAVFVPPKEAFYAGAAQYVGEATEVDETLKNLKSLLDKKIEELEAE